MKNRSLGDIISMACFALGAFVATYGLVYIFFHGTNTSTNYTSWTPPKKVIKYPVDFNVGAIEIDKKLYLYLTNGIKGVTYKLFIIDSNFNKQLLATIAPFVSLKESVFSFPTEMLNTNKPPVTFQIVTDEE
jgi:hypothetical protein